MRNLIHLEVGVNFTQKQLENLRRRFEQQVEPSANGCFLWTGAKKEGGYGRIYAAPGKVLQAHHAAYLLKHGRTPPEPHACHQCRNTACVNLDPEHLVWADAKRNSANNVRDGATARGDQNGSRTHPERVPRGDAHYMRKHPELRPVGEKNAMAKLTAGDVREIRKRASAGEPQKDIAFDYQISESSASLIIRRRLWTHVND